MIPSPDKTPEVLGRHKVFHPNEQQIKILESVGIVQNESLFFVKAKYKNTIFTSTLYKETKYNNYTIEINTFDKYAVINCFIRYKNKIYLLIQNLELTTIAKFVHKKSNSKLNI